LCSANYLQVYGSVNAVYMNQNGGTVVFSVPASGYGISFTVASADGTVNAPTPVITMPSSVQPGDFNGDGHPDLAWQNNTTEQATVWYMGGSAGSTYLGWNWLSESGEPTGWVLVGAADFTTDGTGVPDLVWEYMPTGQVTVNYYSYSPMTGPMYTGWAWLNEHGDPGWTVVAVADVDGNGVPDLIWQNNTTNQVTVNYYGPNPNGAGVVLQDWQWLNSGGEPAGWKVVAAADFDGNGVPDLVWEYEPTRQLAVDYYELVPSSAASVACACMATFTGWAWLNKGAGEPGWTAVGANDFNLDGVPDLVWRNDSTGQVTVNYYGGTGGASLIGWAWLDSAGLTGWTPVVPN
jgi:hypothetical protein